MFKKSYKGRRVKLAAKKSLTVPVAIVTSFIVVLAVSLSTLINKGLVNAFSDSVTPTPSPTSTATESTADLVKSSTISSNKEKKANKENVEESKPQSETTSETVETPQQSQPETTTTSTETTQTSDKGTTPAVAASGNGSVILRMAILQEKSALTPQHKWRLPLASLSQLGSQLLRVSQTVIIPQQMVQEHRVFSKQCQDGAQQQLLRTKFNRL